MTVHEVIEKLQQYPPDAEVWIEGRWGDPELNMCYYDTDGVTLGSHIGRPDEKWHEKKVNE